MTKRELIIGALRDANSNGVCLSDLARLDPTVPYRARNYISEFRKAGMRIEGAPCSQHQHRASVYRYVLHMEPEQLELGA